MLKHAIVIFISLFLIGYAAASPGQIRPYSGCGVLIVQPLNPDRPGDTGPVPFYREPGVARIAELSAGEIPSLSSVLTMSAGEYALAVMEKKGNWLRIAYDDAGREGWVEKARWWDYTTWEVFLKGRFVRLLAGLKKTACTLRERPAETAPQSGMLSGREGLKIIAVEDNWVMVIADSGLHGWLPWRDGDGRFLISVDVNPGL
ncbi:MAG TPA: hypothetical protein VMJ66_08260 [Geobacteraceae bacterium]|nr:hypothetical protein [Geobacteraceae bacterium]